MLPYDLLRQALFLLRARAAGVRDVFVHFAGHHAVVPVLLGFRTHIIVAGSDACSFPGIDYGSFRKRGMARSIAFAMRRAATILPVHASLERFNNTYSDLGPTAQGYAHHVKGGLPRSVEVPYGFDTAFWSAGDARRDPHSVLCVAFGAAPHNNVYHRKGIDLILEAALRLPSHRFTIVGVTPPGAWMDVPDNVSLLGVVNPGALRDLYARTSIYLQPSVMEGFPNALAEAMLMGCLPIASDMTAMPHMVGLAGLLLEKRDAGLLVEAIGRLSALPATEADDRRRMARERMLGYTLQRRISGLLSLTPGRES
jgi:glycosyltransferase involved in cell wall biosynthesis